MTLDRQIEVRLQCVRIPALIVCDFTKDWSRCCDEQSLSVAVKVGWRSNGDGACEQGPPSRL